MREDGRNRRETRRELRREGVLEHFDQTDAVNVNPLFTDSSAHAAELAPLSPNAIIADEEHVTINLQDLGGDAEYDDDWGEAEKIAFVEENQDLMQRGRFV